MGVLTRQSLTLSLSRYRYQKMGVRGVFLVHSSGLTLERRNKCKKSEGQFLLNHDHKLLYESRIEVTKIGANHPRFRVLGFAAVQNFLFNFKLGPWQIAGLRSEDFWLQSETSSKL